MTEHSVIAVGAPLLARGFAKLGLGPGEHIEGRLRVPGHDDIAITADHNGATIKMATPDGAATLETDAAARVLLLWGRRPADPSRVCNKVGPATLGRIRNLLAGY
jgi:hypothetical protein